MVLIEGLDIPSADGRGHALNIAGIPENGWSTIRNEATGKWNVLINTGDVNPSETMQQAIAALQAMPAELGDKLAIVQPGAVSESGLLWLMDPRNWFPGRTKPADVDRIVDQLYDAAASMFPKLPAPDDDGYADALFALQSLAHAQADSAAPSLVRVLEDAGHHIARSRQKYAQKAAGEDGKALSFDLLDHAGDDSSPFANLADAMAHASWFSFTCMLLHLGLIAPPRLDARSPMGGGLFDDDEMPIEPVSVELFNTAAGSSGDQRLKIRIYNELAVTLTQRGDGGTNGRGQKSPYILDNIGWEYLGQPAPDHRHAIALTVGRAVSIETHEDTCAFGFDLAIHWTQMPHLIPRPAGMPLGVGDDAVDVDEINLEENDAQALGHVMQQRPAVHDADLDPGRVYLNANSAVPPFLVHTPMGDGAVKFEWFHVDQDGEPRNPDGSASSVQTGPFYTLILRPANPMAGDFAYNFAIDYVVGDFHAEGPKSPLFTSFRVWYSGEAQIDLAMDSVLNARMPEGGGAYFTDEIVHFDSPFELPPANTRLPTRAFSLAAMNANWSALASFHMAGGEDPIPTWTEVMEPGDDGEPPIMDPGTATPVYVVVEFQQGDWIPFVEWADWDGSPTWDDFGIYVVRADEETRWRSANPDRAAQVDAGTLRLQHGDIVINDRFAIWNTIGTVVIDVSVGFIPIVGDAVDVAEFFYAFSTGKDKWGNPVPTWQLVIMGGAAMCPFVTSGMAKGAIMGGSAALAAGTAYFYTEEMTGRATPGATLLNQGVHAGAHLADEGAEATALTRIMERSQDFRNLGARERADLLAEVAGLPGAKTLIEKLAKKLSDDVGAVMELKDLLTKGANGTDVFIWKGLQQAYEAWRNARLPAGFHNLPAAKQEAMIASRMLTPADFLKSRKFTRGKWKMIAEAFGGSQAIGRITRRTARQRRVLWARFFNMTFEGFTKYPPDQLATRLSGSKVVARFRQSISDHSSEALAFFDDYGHLIDEFLEGASPDEIAKIVGNQPRSPEEAIIVMAHMFEMAEHACRKAGRDIDDIEDLRPLLNELMQGAVTRSGWQHGTLFEFFGNLVRITKNAVDDVPYKLQVRFDDGKLGPDLIEFTEEGFVIVQYKSLSDLARQVGDISSQDNMVQLVKDLVRLSWNNRPWQLADEFIAEGGTSVFSGKYVSVVDLDQFRKAGQEGLEEMWAMTGSIGLRLDQFDHFPEAREALMRLGVPDPDDMELFYLTKLEDYQKVMTDAGEADVLPGLWHLVSEKQAIDMLEMMEGLENTTKLQALLNSSPRARRVLAKFVNKDLPEAYRISPDVLAGPGGANQVFAALGVGNGWMDEAYEGFRANSIRKLRERGGYELETLTDAEIDDLVRSEFGSPFDVEVKGIGDLLVEGI